jgi:hypothetical protein
VVNDFDAWEAKELSGLNSALPKKRLEAIKPLTREEWDKKEGGNKRESHRWERTPTHLEFMVILWKAD